jgi:twitching motility protein PilT
MEPAVDLDLSRVGVHSLKDEMLAAAVALGASDVHVAPGSRPVARVEGALIPLGTAVWGADASASFCRSLCSERHWTEVEKVGTTDFGLAHANGDRFRVSVLRQRNGLAAVLRRIPKTLMTFDQIGLPDVCPTSCQGARPGLVVGPTGSKSTTLADGRLDREPRAPHRDVEDQ